MTRDEFRAELRRRMPGLKWTIRTRARCNAEAMLAVGTRADGLNRACTLEVGYLGAGLLPYEARHYGHGKRAPLTASGRGDTVAQALRDLQATLETLARRYANAADDVQRARSA